MKMEEISRNKVKNNETKIVTSNGGFSNSKLYKTKTVTPRG